MDLSKLDPNLLLGVITLLGSLAGWAWKRARGEKTASITEVLTAAIKQEAARLLRGEEPLEKARDAMRWAATAALERIGVTPSKAVDLLVNVAIEKGLAELAERLHVLERGVAALPGAFQGVVDAFTPPAQPTIPPLRAEFEVVDKVEPCDPASGNLCFSTTPAPTTAARAAEAAEIVRAHLAKDPPK